MANTSGIDRLVSLIDQERERQGLSGRDLATRAGIGMATISRILSRQAAPELDTVDALAVALGYRLETFLAIALSASRKQEEAELLADIVDRLPKEDRDALLNLAQYYLDRRSSA